MKNRAAIAILLSGAIFLIVQAMRAQQTGTGTISVATTITAVAQQSSTDANAVTCVATPVGNQVKVNCKVAGNTGLDSTYTILPNSTSQTTSANSGYTMGQNAVTWLLFQPQSTGPITWQVSANGAMKQGQF